MPLPVAGTLREITVEEPTVSITPARLPFPSAMILCISFTLPGRAEPPSAAAAKVKEVIGHMGSCADRPGNTLVSLRRAIEAGAHVAEVDVRTTKDGVLVCLHDDTVDRTTDGKGKVSGLTLDEPKKRDAGSKFDPK